MLPQQHRGSTLLLTPLFATTRISHPHSPFPHSQSCPVRIAMASELPFRHVASVKKTALVVAMCASWMLRREECFARLLLQAIYVCVFGSLTAAYYN